MKKSIKVKPKKSRGRPATGKDPVVGLRMSANLRGTIVKWAENQSDKPTLSEATRRLVELGLSVDKPQAETPSRISARAKRLAGRAINGLADEQASTGEQADRKRDLLSGPEEFRNVRVDHRKKV
jgi:hypothetical protein